MPAELALWTPLLEAQFYQELETEIRGGARGLCLQGLIEGSRALVLMLLAARTGRPQLIVLPDDTAVLLVHAVNAYGCWHQRRMTLFYSFSGPWLP